MYCVADDGPAGWRSGLLIDGEGLAAGISIEGPAIIAQRNATIVVEPGWRALVTALGNLELRRVRARAAARALGTQADPVMLEVFNNFFMNIAEQMGLSLQNTAHSVNIKERLDFSCAVFDASGNLIANAPHMPVHLGSMSESIRTIIEANPRLAPGEAYVLNDPYRGGTHLPDITVVTPVFLDGRLLTGAGARRRRHACGQLFRGLARPPRRRRRHDAGLDAAILRIDRGRGGADRQLQAPRGGAAARAAASRPADARALPGTQSRAESRRSAGADRRQREGRSGAARHGRSNSAPTRWRATCGMCRTTRRNACAA